MHMTCCNERLALCLKDTTDEEESTLDHLREGEEWCLTCLRLDNDSAPCGSALCPLRSIRDRFRYAWRQGLPGLAVRQLWKRRMR